MDYPVLEIVPELQRQLGAEPVVILQAPPGAGKSTVLPLHLLDEPWLGGKRVIMLEPRRIAAKSVAARLAQLAKVDLGERVGYTVRFESKVSRSTQLHVVTEGILTRMLQSDNSLEDVGLVIFDEFHERSLQADLALALSLQVQQVLRPDLRILIMSATLDSESLALQLKAPIVTSAGRQYPVERRYVGTDPDAPIAARVSRGVMKALSETGGDVLAFLPGASEILRTKDLLENAQVGAELHTLYGDLPFKQQQAALVPSSTGARKVILATSIAETSLTIEGVKAVVDSGYSRVPRYDVRSGLTRLETVRVTRDSADQRAGRAGRLGPGVCYRLWSEASDHHLQPMRKPEIEEADLAPLMLELYQWGVKDIRELNWITSPPKGAVAQANELLTQLDAVDGFAVTPRGRDMLKLPAHPRLAHMMLVAKELGANILSLSTDVAALLEERDPLRDAGADLSLRVDELRKYRGGERVLADRHVLERIETTASSWRKLLGVKASVGITTDKEVGELVAAAYPERIARQETKHGERYKLANGRSVVLPSHDALTREPWIAVAHLDAGSGKIFLAAPLDESDLEHLASDHERVRWDREREAIVASVDRRIGSLTLSSKPLTQVDEGRKVSAWCEAIRELGVGVFGWDEDIRQWQSRVLSLRHWRGTEWPDVGDAALMEGLEHWLSPFLATINKKTELQRLDWKGILPTLLPWDLQRKLNEWAPERLEVPSGSMIKVLYSDDGAAPVMEVRLQEVFGWLETPAVNEGRNRILMHLLSPGYKPVQVTQDLRSFWQHTYHEVRKELFRRYPKHAWPEDPWTAKAVRGVRRTPS